MPIKIGSGIKSALPKGEADGLQEFLLSKSGGKCHLCEATFNEATDLIEADHDVPEVNGGATSRANLWLAHQSCNRAKRDNPSVDVRPYLRLKNYLAGHGHIVKYDGVLPHFKITPKASKVNVESETIRVDLPNGERAEAPIFTDVNRSGQAFRYCFVNVPREALKNDDQVQPRSLKIAQVWSIYSDLATNPLHEPPSCRLVEAGQGMHHFGLFDGQHKTVATWMTGAKTVTIKVYLDLTKDQANYLVNSIQAKIKKLPLSPFELSAKLSDEWAALLEAYRERVPAESASEAGFIQWLDKSDRARAKSAFEAALLRELVGSPDLGLIRYVHLSGQPQTETSLMTETQFNTRILKRLLHTAPLAEKGLVAEELRQREKQNIVTALNMWRELVFEPEEGALELTEMQAERRRRMLYGGAMAYVADLIKSLYRHTFAVEPERAFLDKTPNDTTEGQILTGMERLVNHPIWVCDFDQSEKTKEFRDALLKNQDVASVAGAVGLKLGYVVGADELSNHWYV